MKQVVFQQSSSGSPDTEAWHIWRLNGIGGSDAPVIAVDAGLCKKKPSWMKGIHYLWQVKTRQIQEVHTDETEEQLRKYKRLFGKERGKAGEEPARIAYEKRTGIMMQPVFGEMDGYEFVRSSFDGRSFCEKIILELKCAGEDVHTNAEMGFIAEYYLPQVIHQANTSWGHPSGWDSDLEIHFGNYIPEKDDLALVTIKAAKYRKYAEELLNLEIAFWDKVKSATPPAGREFIEAANAYVKAYRIGEESKLKLEEAKAKLLELFGNQVRMDAGVLSIARAPREGNVDYVAMIQSLVPTLTEEGIAAEMEKFRKKGSEVVTIRVNKPKETKPKKQKESA